MKILMVSPYFPWPLHGGGSVRIFNILRELSQRKHQVTLLAGKEDEKLEPDNILNQICEKVHLYNVPSGNRLIFMFQSIFSDQPYPFSRFQTDSLKKNLNNLLKNQKFDLIWINPLISTAIIPSNLIKNTPIVVDQHECEDWVYQAYLREGNLGERLLAFINLMKIKNFKQKIFSQSDAILCVSKEEADFTQRQAKEKVKVLVVPNGVDEDFFRPPSLFLAEKNIIILCSNMSIRRNIDAAVWFARNIFPKIRAEIPDAEFWIVGKNPAAKVWKLNSIPGVKVTGTVQDIKEYYLKGKVFVSPYRFGAGTKLKVLEAMASGIPIVSTTVGCLGIGLVDGKHLLIADSEADFSNRVIKLLENPELAQRLAEAALSLAKEKYQWKKIVENLEPELLELLRQKNR